MNEPKSPFTVTGELTYLAAPNIFCMEYSRIVAVTGMPGLFEILSSKSDGAIVRSLEDESTKFVSSRVHNLSHLESIEIYTDGENVSLSDVFAAMKNNSEALPDIKDSKALKGYFEKVFPQMDTERVYASDMKKMVNWFNVLEKNSVDYTVKEQEPEEENLTEPEETTAREETGPATKPKKAAKSTETEQPVEKTAKEAPAKEAPAKKAAAKKQSSAASETSETKEAPKKKAPAKKKKDEE